MTRTTLIAKASIIGITLTIGGALAGCGDNSTADTPSVPAATSATAAPQTAHNAADVAFATDMIPHHAQAVSMSGLAADHGGSAQVKDLAGRIEAAQQPEIDQMSGWLKAWNAPVPDAEDPTMGGMSGMDHNAAPGMPGMMTSDQMQRLNSSRGAAFDTLFLKMMISHHQGAIAMANTELANGQSSDAKALARTIVDAQQAEINQMRAWQTKS